MSSSYFIFATQRDAEVEIDGRVKNASRVISWPESGAEGLERAVIVLKSSNECVIIRQRGNRIHTIESMSLRNALEFEKRGKFEMEAPNGGAPN